MGYFSNEAKRGWFGSTLFILAGFGGWADALAAPGQIQPGPGSSVVLERKDRAVRDMLEAQVGKVLADPQVQKKIMAAGKRRTILCNVCHGEDGNSLKPEVPKLAGQNPVYLVDQFQRFGDGRRYDFAMSTLAETFSEEEKVLLALYYSQLPLRPAGGGSPEQRQRGEEIYRKNCTGCHGETGRGEEGYARLAGQQPTYVVNMLNEFRNRTGRRSNPWMTAVALHLNEQDVQDVAVFIANLE